ncbi:Tkl protein kinase, partial [Globisporangium splendens]
MLAHKDTPAALDVQHALGSLMLFPTQGLLLSALSTVHQLCLQAKDRQNASLQLHARLHQVFLRITNSASHGTLSKGFEVSSFTSLLNQFRLVLEQHVRLKNIVLRMLASRRFLASIKKVHEELSALITKWHLASATSATMVWKEQFAINLHLDEKTLHATLRALLATTFVSKEYFSERRQSQILMELVCEFAPERERSKHNSPHLLETLKMTHKRISNYSGVHIRRVPRWFLPRSEVEGTDKYKMVGHGSFASTLFRGDYFGVDVGSTGGHAVAVKYLWPLKDAYYTQVEHVFVQTVQEWWHINHPNVAQVRGACHVASPPYIVRDFAAYGNLTTYIGAVRAHANDPKPGESKAHKIETVMWELIYGACKGVLYLHERRKLVHGGLRCNNILVSKSGQAVVADYGMRALACEVRKHNMDVDHAKVDESEYIRWQAPECLLEESGASLFFASEASVPSSNANLSFASDVYALGMCILEAVTGAVPWSDLDISEVRSLKQNLGGVLPPRPKRMHTDVWSLVQRMCVADPKQRISLRTVLTEIKGLGYVGYGSKNVQIETPKQSGNDDGHAPSAKASENDSIVTLSSASGQQSNDAVQVPNNAEGRNNQGAEVADPGCTSEQQIGAQGHASVSKSKQDSSRSSLKSMGVDSDTPSPVVETPENAEAVNAQDASILINDQSPDHVIAAAAEIAERSTFGIPKKSEEAAELPQGSVHGTDELPAPERKVYSSILRPMNGAESEAPVMELASQLEILETSDEEDVVPDIDLVFLNPKITAPMEGDDGDKEKSDDALAKVNGADRETKPVVEDMNFVVEYQDVQVQGTIQGIEKCSAMDIIGPSEEEVNIFLVKNTKASPKKLSSTASTVEPEHEIESSDASFVGEHKDICSLDREVKKPEAVEEAPISLTSELRNRIKSNGPNYDRSSFLDNLLRATTLRTEYMTAKETSELPPPPPLSTPRFVDLVETIKAHDQPEVVLQALGMLRNGLRRDKQDVDWTEQGGILALLQIIWKGISKKCTCLALDILVEIAVQNPEDIEAMVDSDVVKVLTKFIEYRGASEELDLVASFLLEILAKSDNAKDRLWRSEGIKVLEANTAIDRRLVQEIKSIMAKYKSSWVTLRLFLMYWEIISQGHTHMNRGEYDLAVERFTEAIALDRKRAGYYCDRSLAYYEASLFKKAADDASRCMRYNPYDVVGYLRHGMALKALGRYNEAIVSLRKGRQVDPKYSKIRDIITEIEDLRRGRGREDVPPEPVSVSPEEIVKAKKKEGDDALRKKQYDIAVRHYTDALAIDKRNDLIYLHRSIAHSGCGLYDRAIEDASKCIQINYRQIEGYYRLALALNAKGQYDQALRTLYRGQEIDSRHSGITRFIQQLEEEQAKRAGLSLPSWFKEKGYQAFQLRSYEEAIKFYTKGIAASTCDHDDVALHCFFYRARANQCRGEFSAVIMDCTHILHHNPKNVFARLRRADAYEQQRDYFMALQDMQELVIFNPDFESARARLESLQVRLQFLPRTNLQHVL